MHAQNIGACLELFSRVENIFGNFFDKKLFFENLFSYLFVFTCFLRIILKNNRTNIKND